MNLRESNSAPGPRVWAVGALCRAVADALDARFNPVAVRGEISGFSRASSGHCYFSLKDESGQLRCAMFRRAAGLLDFSPRTVTGLKRASSASATAWHKAPTAQTRGPGAEFMSRKLTKCTLGQMPLFHNARSAP